ncbi:MAG: PilZ domain-containing protein [Parvularculaceae bacterium]
MAKSNSTRLDARLSSLSKTSGRSSTGGFNSKPKKPRGKDRQSTFRIGVIVCDSSSSYPCVVKDLSETGARVALEGEYGLSPRITLRIDQAGLKKQAHVVWQDGVEVGLSFEE